MNCINCYQEIPDESRFCPHCGAEQPDTPKTETAAPADSPVQTETNQTAYQDSQTYGSGYQENHTSDYQNNQYQTPPVYQSSYEPENQINWVPYLVLSIISTVCCCVPFGIVAIVYAAKINSSVTAGDTAGAEKAARTSKIWIFASFVAGILATVLYILIFAGIGASSGYYYYS